MLRVLCVLLTKSYTQIVSTLMCAHNIVLRAVVSIWVTDFGSQHQDVPFNTVHHPLVCYRWHLVIAVSMRVNCVAKRDLV